MKKLLRLRSDNRGATVVEMAFVLPILILMIYGIFMVGVIFQANAGMQHALGEGARLANIYPVPTNTAISNRMAAKLFGTGNGTFTPTVADGTGGNACNTTSTSTNFKTLRVTFTMPVSFLFFTAPNLNISRCKTVYVAD